MPTLSRGGAGAATRAKPKDGEKYNLDARFERAAVALVIAKPYAWRGIGRLMKQDFMPTRNGVLGVMLAHLAAGEQEGVPGGIGVVYQIAAVVGEDGGKEQVELNQCLAWIEDGWGDIESKALNEDSVYRALVAAVKQHGKDDAAGDLLKRWSNKLDTTKAFAKFAAAEAIGEVEDVGTEVTSAAARLRVIAQAQDAVVIPTGILALDVGMGGGLTVGNCGFIAGGPGDGKCHRGGQGILMHDGRVKAVEDIVVGDLLAGPSGPRRVMRTNSGHGRMYEVQPKRGGAPWQVNIDHVLTLVAYGEGKHKKRSFVGGEMIDVTVREWLTWSAKRKHAYKLVRRPYDFDRAARELPVDPYFLGVLLGDGGMQGGVNVTTMEPKVVDEVYWQAENYGLKVRVQTKPDNLASTYTLSSGKACKNLLLTELRGLGLFGKGAGTKFVPGVYKTASREVRAAVLAGLIDTDGAKNKSAYDYVSKSRQLAEDVCFLGRSLGMQATIASCEKSCQTGAVDTYWRVGLSGPTAQVPSRCKPLPLRRQKKDVLRTGFDIVDTGEDHPFYGFTLDGDGRYLLDDFTVTHNSSAVSQIMAFTAGALKRASALVSVELKARQNILKFEAALWGIPIDTLKRNPGILNEKYERRGSEVAPFFFKHIELRRGSKPKITAAFEFVEEQEQKSGVHIDLTGFDHFDRFDPSWSGSSKLGDYAKGEALYDEIAQWTDDGKRATWMPSHCVRKKSGPLWGPGDMAHSNHKEKRADAVFALTAGGKPGARTITAWLFKNREGEANIIVGPEPVGFAMGCAFEVGILLEVDPLYAGLV